MRLKSVVFVMAMVPVLAAAQQFMPTVGPPVAPNLRFEVVVIRPVDSANRQLLMRTTPGRFEAVMPLGILVRQALQKSDYQIIGLPGWVDIERYSISATTPEHAPPGATGVMLANLLKDRFQMVTHVETRELPIFNLVLARPDGRPGPDLKPTSAECQATIAQREADAKAAAAGRGGPPPAMPPLPGPGEALPCGFGRVGLGSVAVSGRTVSQFIATLSDLTRRPVIDKTGLTGMYDFALKFAADSASIPGPFGLLQPTPPPPGDPDAPSVFTAVQEQLGLRLENARGPVEVVVIDKIEKPTLD
jgi:uncharacterized protein (TIGR03435 family)